MKAVIFTWQQRDSKSRHLVKEMNHSIKRVLGTWEINTFTHLCFLLIDIVMPVSIPVLLGGSPYLQFADWRIFNFEYCRHPNKSN